MKLIGILAISFSGAVLLINLLRNADAELASARGLCAFIRHTRRLVECFSMSAEEIISLCPKEIISACGFDDGETLPLSLSEFGERCNIPDGECRRIFLEFTADFGKNYRAGEVRRCDFYAGLMEEREARIAEKLPSKKKLTAAVVISSLLMTVIFLI